MLLNNKSFSAVASALLVSGFMASGVQAAPIDIVSGPKPELTLSSGGVNSLTYTYVAVCQDGGTNVGACGGAFTTPRWDLTYGRLVIQGDALTLNPDGSGLLPVIDLNGSTVNYSLTVVLGFTDATALSGVLATDPFAGDTTYNSGLSASGLTANPSFVGPTLVTGTPVDATGYGYPYTFGYAGSDAGGVLEFVFNNVGGNFASFGSVGGIIASTFNLTNSTGSWDSQGIDFWKTAHAGTATVTTFVPLPPALALLAPGFALLYPWVRRRKAA